MADSVSSLAVLQSVRLPSLRAFLANRGYKFRERWGAYLDRFSRKIGSREQNVIIPNVRDIKDFDQRLLDAFDALSRQLKTTVSELVREVVNSGYQIVRIKANEGDQSSTLGYDAAIDLLRGGFALIDSSAVVATADYSVSIVRGRRPDAVRRYLDAIRVGQTEVGSFVLTLLMPIGIEAGTMDLPGTVSEGFGSKVSERLVGALQAAELAVRKGELRTKRAMVERGLTSNFSAGIARMIEAVGDVTISLAPATDARRLPQFTASKFLASDLLAFREIERRLTPAEERKPFSLAGTITEFREPRGKTSGTIVLTSEIYGEARPVRLRFGRSERLTIIEALERKAELLLSVEGDLIARGGHFSLEEPRDFRLVPRGLLT